MDKNQPLTESVFYILLALRKPNHGYGVVQDIQELTGGRINMGAGTLYGAMQTLEKKGYIEIYSAQEESRKKKEYIITELGRSVFTQEADRLKELLDHAQLMNTDR